MIERPIPDSYWVEPGRFLAGEYPGAPLEHDARAKLARLREAGIQVFIDLTEPEEYGLRPYTELVADWAAYRRYSIRDLRCLPRQGMIEILDAVDGYLATDRAIYVHCYGGIGRTGTVVGCWLVRHGMGGEQALTTVAMWRKDTPDGHRRSPETGEQIEMVLRWTPGR